MRYRRRQQTPHQHVTALQKTLCKLTALKKKNRTHVASSAKAKKTKKCVGRESNPGLIELPNVAVYRNFMATMNFTTKPPTLIMLIDDKKTVCFKYIF